MPSLYTASALRLGTANVTRAYLGSTQVWPAEDVDDGGGILQQASGTWTGATMEVSLPSATLGTSTVALFIMGNTTISTPAGWTLRRSEVANMGHYLFTRDGDGTNSWSIPAAFTGTWYVAEIGNGEYDTGASANNTTGSMTYTTPNLVPTAGTRLMIASVGGANNNPNTIVSWNNDFTEVADVYVAQMDRPMQGVATRTVTANGSDTYSTMATYQFSTESRTAIIASFVTTGGGSGGSAPFVAGVTPVNAAIDISTTTLATAVFNKAMNAGTITTSSVTMKDASNANVSITLNYNAGTRTVTITPTTTLENSTQYTITLSTSIADTDGNTLTAPYSWSFTTVAAVGGINPLAMGHGGPILLVTKSGQMTTEYYSEILRAEGLNSFDTIELSDMDTTVLDEHDVVLLGAMSLTNGQVSTLEDWVSDGGKLIAMRPDKKLASLLGLVDVSATYSDTYIKVNTSTAPGLGITGQTMQYHGIADRYTLTGGATAIASLCSNATTETANPAVTVRNVGVNGGVAAAFTYDLAHSVTLTHQGNPAWAGQDRDSNGVIRPNDLFYGAMTGDSQSDYVDLDKVAIPQADEQQRLLANIINEINKEIQPLPKFSYLPYNDKAVIVMVCDDHATANAVTELNYMIAESPSGGSVEDWECVRSTSLMYTYTPLTDGQVAAYAAQGFDFGVHMNTNGNWTPTSLAAVYNQDFSDFQAKYTSIPPQRISRNHAIAWSDYITMAKEGLNHGVRLDLNYYYWPGSWVQNRPGFMSGSGMVMRFADTDNSMIDVYQLPSHLVNESGQTWPQNIDLMLERALGSEGYYGILGTHYDYSDNFDRQLIQSAKAHNVRLVSGEQILKWTDGRNASYFTPGTWSGNVYTFTATVHSDMRQMGRVLLPMSGKGNKVITGITRGGVSQSFTVETMKGVSYAVFTAASGTYEVTYSTDTTPPTVIGVVPETDATEVSTGTDIEITFSEPLDPATVTTTNVQLLDGGLSIPITVSYEAYDNTIQITPLGDLAALTTYTIQIGAVQDASGVALATTYMSSFTTSAGATIWAPAAPQSVTYQNNDGSVELGLRFQSSQAGEIAQIKFYKNPSDVLTTHTVTLWSPIGEVMATTTTSGETASGWQTATLSAPVAIDADTTYTASYLAPSGFYSYTSGGLSSAVVRGPLTALAGGGVYRYPSGYPNSSGNTNYWIDVALVLPSGTPGGFVPNLINNPSSGGYPDATNTGVPVGESLTNSGSVTVSTNGAVIQNLNIVNGNITVNADDVTIRNCRITTNDYYPIENNGTNLVIEDCEITGTDPNVAAAVSFSNYTARRLNVSGSADGFKADADCMIQDCYIHDLVVTEDSHNDGIQSTGGDNVTVWHNTIDTDTAGVAIQFGSSNSGWLINDNLIRATGWALNGNAGTGGCTVTNNRFAPVSGWYGPYSLEGIGNTYSGNYYDDSGVFID